MRVFDSDGRIYAEYALLLRVLGDLDATIRAADQGLSLVKSGSWRAVLLEQKTLAQLDLGLEDSAVRTAAEAIATIGEEVHALYPMFYALAGDSAQAKTLLRRLEDSGIGHPVGMLHAYVFVNDFDSAFRWISRCFENPQGNWVALAYLRTDPIYEDLKQDHRWEDVLQMYASFEALVDY